MEEKTKLNSAHCLVLASPIQGHINPMLQFCKRLQHKGVKATLVTTRFLANSITRHKSSNSSIDFETISDGFDERGFESAGSTKCYLDRFREVGSVTLAQLVQKLNSSDKPVDCIVYDAFFPWCLDVAKSFGLFGAVFFTQSCAVDSIYDHVNKGSLKVPVTEKEIVLPALPVLKPQDLPHCLYKFGSDPAVFEMFVDSQFSNIDKVDFVLCNTVYELEQETVDWLSKLWPLKTIGPTIPSMYLDKQLQNDVDYGFSIFKPNHDDCINWLNHKAKGSVVYVSFGSLAVLTVEQMDELSWGLKTSKVSFLWVVRASEKDKLPKNFTEETKETGLIVPWCQQLEVLSHEAIGCFMTHCGWNSTLEAVSLGVPMLTIPQGTDQSTNAKYIVDVWKMGIRASADDEKQIIKRDVVKSSIREIMEGERGKSIRQNAEKWRNLVKKAMDVGGSSNENINSFVDSLVGST